MSASLSGIGPSGWSTSNRRPRIGIMDHESLFLGGSQHVVARMAVSLADTCDVEIIHSGRGYTIAELGSAFGLEMDGIRERVVEDALASFSVPGSRSTLLQMATGFRRERALTRPYDLFIYSGHRTPPLCSRGRGLVYCHFPFDAGPSIHLEDNARWNVRSALSRSLRSWLYERVWKRRMVGFPILLANSRFSAEWIERLWGRRAEVIYPPVATVAAGVSKRDLIVSVGRFFDTDHKNVRGQLKAFPEFFRQVGGDWTLCLIGFCSDREQDRRFLDGLRESAGDLPVRFLVNANREEISRVLSEAKLFWHTAGLSEDGVSTPPRFQEHFGMATVEAMRAGCVPIVPDAGGQPEIVRHGESGFLCRDLEDLVGLSVAVAQEEALRDRIAREAIRRSLDFAPQVFEERIRKSVAQVLAGRQQSSSLATEQLT